MVLSSSKKSKCVKTPALRRQGKKQSKPRATYKKMTVGKETSTSKKYDVRIVGDCDVADVYHHMEPEKPDTIIFIIFGETDRMYGGFRSGRMGEYFSITFTKTGGFEIKDRIDWEEGIDMANSMYRVWYVKHADLIEIPGYTHQDVRI